MSNMNNVIRKHNSSVMKDPIPPTTKTCNCRKKTVTVFLNVLFIKHPLIHLPIEFTTVLVKILLKSVTTTIHVLSEINLVKRTLNCPRTYGN